MYTTSKLTDLLSATTSNGLYPESGFDNAKSFSNLSELIASVDNSGSYFFRDDTMKAWGTRFVDLLVDGKFFVTSEKGWDKKRVYSVRYVTPKNSVNTIDTLATPGQAKSLVKQIVKFLLKDEEL